MKLFGRENFKKLSFGYNFAGRVSSLVELKDVGVNQSVESLQTKAQTSKRRNNSSSKNIKTSEKASAGVNAQTEQSVGDSSYVNVKLKKRRVKVINKAQPLMRKQLTMPKRLPSSNKESMLLDEDLISEDLISLDSEEDQEVKAKPHKTLPIIQNPVSIKSNNELPAKVQIK